MLSPVLQNLLIRYIKENVHDFDFFYFFLYLLLHTDCSQKIPSFKKEGHTFLYLLTQYCYIKKSSSELNVNLQRN